MNYQEIVDRLRKHEDYFIRVGDFWPGHHGPATSQYPNLAAELVARECQIGTPVNAAGISREAFAAVIEDGAELGKVQLWKIALRLEITVGYLRASTLALVDPSTIKGQRKLLLLRRRLQQPGASYGIHTINARKTLAALDHGKPVTYAAWRWAMVAGKLP